MHLLQLYLRNSTVPLSSDQQTAHASVSPSPLQVRMPLCESLASDPILTVKVEQCNLNTPKWKKGGS